MDGMKRHMLHKDAWTIFKDLKVEPKGVGKKVGISTALKQKILEGAIRDRQNLIIPSCANQPEKLMEEMSLLQKARGSLVHLHYLKVAPM